MDAKMHVWDRVQRSEASKVIGTRWVYVDKGDQVRCRLVAQEFAGSDKREDLYAGTPPLSATRYLLSNTASRCRRVSSFPSRKLMVLDIKRAFLHGLVTRTIYVELLEEESEGGKYVGRLVKTLYGTRDAQSIGKESSRAIWPIWDSRSARSPQGCTSTEVVTFA